MEKLEIKQVPLPVEKWGELNSGVFKISNFEPKLRHRQLTEFLFEADELPIGVLHNIARYASDSRSREIDRAIWVTDELIKSFVEYAAPKIILPTDIQVLIELILRPPSPHFFGIALGHYLQMVPQDIIEELREKVFLQRMVKRMSCVDDHSLEGLTTAFGEKISRECVKEAKWRGVTFFQGAWKYINTKLEEVAYKINRYSRPGEIPVHCIKETKPELLLKVAPLIKHYHVYQYILRLEAEREARRKARRKANGN